MHASAVCAQLISLVDCTKNIETDKAYCLSYISIRGLGSQSEGTFP